MVDPAATATEALRNVVRAGRRARGAVKSRSVRASGVAPSAVVTAIAKATAGVPSGDERAWVNRIELMRELLLTSPAPLELVDFGAGTAHRFDDGTADTVNVVHKTLGAMTLSSKPRRWAYLLFRLVRELQPEAVLELGACVGISASYEAAALRLNGRGRLITLEGAEPLAERSRHTLREFGLDDIADVRLGRFGDTIDAAIADLPPLGIAFIDGHHVESATVEYMERLLPALASEAVLVFDDINWSAGMRRAWETIAADDRFAFTADLRSVGLAAVSASATTKTHVAIPYR